MDATLEDLLRFSGFYAAFVLGRGPSSKLGEALRSLRRLVDVPAILITRLFHCFSELDTLDEQAFVDSVRLIESYVVRRQVCGLQTRGYWSVFANIAYALNLNDPAKSLSVSLARQRESYRFPSDEEFSRALHEDNLYGMRVCRHILEGLENAGQLEKSNTGHYQIEHVMPQHLTHHWIRMLGEGGREVHETWLHRLGNLTLTGYNARYSDLPFEKKKSISGGFDESAVRLNRWVRGQSKWTSTEISERGTILAKNAIQIWPHHRVPQELIEESDIDELKNRAAASDISAVDMTEIAGQLFKLLRSEVLAIGEEVIEIAAPKSISYYAPEFFLEMLPRKTRILLVLPPEFNEIDDPTSLAYENTYKFLVNCEHDGGVLINVDRKSRIAPALGVIRQALNLLDS